jgi:hypothetical protein
VKDGDLVAGLAACGVAMGIVSTASDLMQVQLFHLDPQVYSFFLLFLIKARSACVAIYFLFFSKIQS